MGHEDSSRQWRSLDQIDFLIQKGQLAQARRELLRSFGTVNLRRKNKFPRELAVRLAALYRRAGQPARGVLLLHPLMNPPELLRGNATGAERCEYAAGLVQLGAHFEARRILVTVNPTETPQALLFRAFLHFSAWEYAEAVPVVAKYLSMPSLSEYERLVGTVNWVAALVGNDLAESALPAIETALQQTEAKEYIRLRGNLHEIAAQAHIELGSFSAARSHLQHAAAALTDETLPEKFLIEKWLAILDAKERGSTPEVATRLALIRAQALGAGKWEVARDCDYQLALLTQDRARLKQVYFGTPSHAYRQRLLREAGPDLAPTVSPFDSFCWDLAPDTAGSKPILDSLSGSWNERPGVSLKPGQLPQRLLQILASDFYRPWRVSSVYERMFPEQRWNPHSSSQVVHQAIHRLRVWLRGHRIPLKLLENGSLYRLGASRALALRVHELPRVNGGNFDSALHLEMSRLFAKLGPESFSIQQAITLLDRPERTTRRLLAQACLHKLVERVGAGNRTRYRITSRR